MSIEQGAVSPVAAASRPVPEPRHNQPTAWNMLARWLMPVSACLLLVAVTIGIAIAWNWPLIHDAPLIHYVVFLMDHGRAPYRDIIEMNMPGSYMIEWAVMHGLGGDARAWWLWDVLSGGATIFAGAWIAGAARRWAGAAGGAFAYLLHLSDGAVNLGQRDWMVAVMLLLAFGCMFETIRRDRPAWMAGFMGLCGLAASIKPPAIGIGICFLVATCWIEGRRKATWRGAAGSSRKLVAWSLVGGLVPTLAVAIFLALWGVTGDFFGRLHGLVLFHASLGRVPYPSLIRRAITLPTRPLLLGAGLLFLLNRSWRSWESSFLAAAAVAGAALFLIQAKGWSYHLYPELAFTALWGMRELQPGLQGGRLQRIVATATLIATVLVATPWLLKAEYASPLRMETVAHLEDDLNRLGGARLSGKIQCLDMAMGGCINVLYRMKLVQSTGFIYDFYLFPKHTNSVTEPLQARFLREIDSKPPEVIVLSSHAWPSDTYSYTQIENWPSFKDLLQRNYHLDSELPKQRDSAGYRIYVLNEKTE